MPAPLTPASGEGARSTIGTLVYILLGPLLWALHLTVIYGVHTLACARGITLGTLPGVGLTEVAIAAATLAVLVILAAALARPDLFRRLLRTSGFPAEQQSFNDRLMITLALLSGLAVLFAAATLLVIIPCAPLR